MRLSDIAADSLVWTWEHSLDGGASYDLMWRADYERAG
jgi:hypothetical protein